MLGWVNGLSHWCSVIYGVMALSPSVADLLPAARIAWCNQAWPWPGGPKSTGYSTQNSEGCAREADLIVGASPTRRIGLFTAEHDLNSVAARRGWMLRKMNRRAVTKVNHI